MKLHNFPSLLFICLFEVKFRKQIWDQRKHFESEKPTWKIVKHDNAQLLHAAKSHTIYHIAFDEIIKCLIRKRLPCVIHIDLSLKYDAPRCLVNMYLYLSQSYNRALLFCFVKQFLQLSYSSFNGLEIIMCLWKYLRISLTGWITNKEHDFEILFRIRSHPPQWSKASSHQSKEQTEFASLSVIIYLMRTYYHYQMIAWRNLFGRNLYHLVKKIYKEMQCRTCNLDQDDKNYWKYLELGANESVSWQQYLWIWHHTFLTRGNSKQIQRFSWIIACFTIQFSWKLMILNSTFWLHGID